MEKSSLPKPTFEDVRNAGDRLTGISHRTPVVTSTAANHDAGARLFFKCENLQRAGAFKFRGAYNAVAMLSSHDRATGVLAFSSGNHAQAIALACRLQGVRATILMPQDAPSAKINATVSYGAEVVFYDRYSQDRESIARSIANGQGLALIPPYDDFDIISGQGTAALELFEAVGTLDYLLVCLGGGGLLAGSALAAAAMSPDCKVIGVEPEAGDDGRQSFETGRIVRIPVPKSIADGALTTHLGDLTFPIIRKFVDAIVTVSDAEIIGTLRFIAERMKMVVEPTGCLAAAAAFAGRLPLQGKRVGIILSGGNMDMESYGRLLSGR